jgi:hypothetical protein
MFFGSETISANSGLTPEGCLHVIRNLWRHNDRLFHQLHHHADNLDPLSVSEDALRRPIHDALPRDIEMEDSAWPQLFSISRSMLTWREMAWEQGWEAILPSEHMRSWQEELWNICAGAHD